MLEQCSLPTLAQCFVQLIEYLLMEERSRGGIK